MEQMNIYTTGSSEFLEMMLNASAMVTGSGTTEDLARIGLLLGMLLLAFQATWDAQGISFHKAGVLLVLYMIFYGPTTTTVIEDTTTGNVRIVDNVPVGPAFVGSVISTIFYEVTKVTEQAYSTPTMTEYGLFSSLNTLAKVRDTLRNPMSLDSFVNYGSATGWNLPRSMDEYLTFCTLNPISLREYQNIDQLYRASGLDGITNAPLTSQYVYVYDGTPGGNLVSCVSARSTLNAAMRNVVNDLMADILDKGFATEKASGQMSTGSEVEGRISDAIQSFGISGKSAQEYTMMSLIQPIFGDARVNALNHWQEQNAALALRQSLNQQEIQWAGKGDMFKHYMRPMIAFFEGLLYAMSPFMAFALVLGGAGLKIMAKYLVLPLSVGLWMPMLSVVNAFTLWYAGSEVEAIFNGYDATGTGFAILQLLDIDHAISKALGIGGLLAASVPPLSLFLVTGSAMVANSIMSQMTQGDKFKSEDVLPRAKEQAPVMETNSAYSSDQLTQGASVTGARGAAPKLSAGVAAQAQVSSDQQYAETATQQLKESIGAGSAQLASTSEGRQTLAGLGRSMASNLTGSEASNYAQASSYLESQGWSKQEIEASSFGMHAGVSLPFGLGGTNLKDDERYQNMSEDGKKAAEQAVSTLQSSLQSSNSEGDLFSTAENFIRATQATSQSGVTEGVEKSLNSAQTAQQAYNLSSSNSESWAAKQDLDLGQAASNSIANSGETRNNAARGLADIAGKTDEDRAAIRDLKNSEMVRGISTDNDERSIAASTMHLLQTGRLDELMGSKYDPFNFGVDVGHSDANAHMSSSAPSTGGMEGRVNSQIGANGNAYDEMNDMNSSGRYATTDSGADVIAGSANGYQNQVMERADMDKGRMEAFLDDNSIPSVDINVDSTNENYDTAANYVAAPISSVSNGAEQLATGAATLAGVEDVPAVQAGIRFASSPVDTAITGAKQIADFATGLVGGKDKPPKID